MKSNELLRKFINYSDFNPVKPVVAKEILHSNPDNKEALNFIKMQSDNEDFNNFTEIFTLQYLALETKDLINLPYEEMLAMQTSMSQLYTKSLEPTGSFDYEGQMQELAVEIKEHSEDAWETFIKIREYVIYAYKLDLLNFELDEYIEYFFKIYEHLVVQEAKLLNEIYKDRMDAFGTQVYLSKVSVNQEKILKAIIYKEDPYEVLAPALRDKEISLEDKIEIADFFCRLCEELDITHYKALVRKNPKWFTWLDQEVIERLHQCAVDYFSELDCSLLSEEIADYIIMYNLYYKGSIEADKVAQLMKPLILAKTEINEKIERFGYCIQEVMKCKKK